MAPLNPTPQPVQDPNYIYWSREIQQPEADKSGQYSWTGAGQALEIGAKGADLAIKQGIASGMEKDLRPVEEQFTNNLQGYYNQLTGTPGAGQPQAGQSIGGSAGGTGVDAQTMPQDLKKLPDQLDALASRRANGNLSNTYYVGQLYQIAKDYRDRFDSPGYHEFIDEQFHRITGIRPANAQIQSLLSDINSYVSQKDTLTNKVLSELSTGDYVGGAQIAQQIKSGQMNPYQGIAWLETRRAPAAEARRKMAQIEFLQGNRKLLADQAAGPAGSYINHLAFENMDNMVVQGGVKMKDLIAGVGNANAFHPTDDQWQMLGQMAKSNMLTTQSRMLDWMHTQQVGDTGMSVYEAIGDAKAKEIIDNALSMHKQWITAINNKDEGFMYMHLHHAQSAVNQGISSMLGDPDARRSATMLKFAQDFGGPNAWPWLQGMKDSLDASSANVSASLDHGYLRSIGQVGPDLRPNVGAQNPPSYTATQMFRESAAATKSSPLEQRMGTRAIAELPSRVMLTDQIDDRGKINFARTFFGDPKSLFNLNPSGTGADGRPIKGRDDYFAQWSSPAVTQEIKRLSQQDHALWPMYKGWVEQTGSALYAEKIGDINHLSNMEGIRVTYNSENHRLEAVDQPGANRRASGMYQATPAYTIQPQINRLNSLFNVWADLAKQSGEEPNAYILKTLQQHGVDLKKISPQIHAAITNSLQYQDENEDGSQKGSLQGFLANPTGVVAAKQPVEDRYAIGDSIIGTPQNAPPLPLNELIRRQREGR